LKAEINEHPYPLILFEKEGQGHGGETVFVSQNEYKQYNGIKDGEVFNADRISRSDWYMGFFKLL